MDVGRWAAAVARVVVASAVSLAASAAASGAGGASPAPVGASAPAPPSRELLRLAATLEDVTGADAHRTGARDEGGRTLDGLKVVASGVASPRYLGVHHDRRRGAFEVGLVVSDDLVRWRRAATLGRQASQATIRRLAGGGFLVAWEQEPRNHVRVVHYADREALLRGRSDARFDAPLTLAPTAEGTPDIRSVSLRDGLGDSTIVLGLHYYRDRDVDREAIATLTDFRTWVARPRPELDAALARRGLRGNFGDRDTFVVDGRRYEVVEGQGRKGAPATWGTYLRDDRTGAMVPLRMRVPEGQRAFGNPTVSVLPGPRGGTVLFSTAFAFSEGAPRRAGEVLSHRRLR